MRWMNTGSRCFSSLVCSNLAYFPAGVSDYRKILCSGCYEVPRLKSCSYHSSTESPANTLHAKSLKDGSLQNLSMGNYIMSLYLKSEDLDNAGKLFADMPERDVRSWTVLMSYFSRRGAFGRTLELFREMKDDGLSPNQYSLSSVLKSCPRAGDWRDAKGIHGWILRNGISLDSVLENSLLDAYAKFEAFEYVKNVFSSLGEKTTVSYNIMLGAYMLMGEVEKSIDLFRILPEKDNASWNTMMDGLLQNGYENTALELLYQMGNHGPEFNKFTFSIAFSLASSLSNKELGRQVHGRVLRFGLDTDGFVRNSLMDMYCKCGDLEKASVIYRRLHLNQRKTQNSKATFNDPLGEIVLHSLMVSGYVRNGKYEDAMKIFMSMRRLQIVVDRYTVTSIVSACSNAGILDLGRQIHAYIQKIGHKLDFHLISSLIDMYAKCGSLDNAWQIFRQTTYLNIVLWTSMISACALHGHGRDAIRLFEWMISEGDKPNEVTFVAILTACSHAGMLEEGCKYFRMMKEVYGIKPAVEHFTCMVDLYGRAGCLEKVKDFIHDNGISHLTPVWKAFLSACRLYKDINTGNWVSERLFELEPNDPGGYVLLSNTWSIDHRWEEAAKLRSSMQQGGVNKTPGLSWIQLKNQVHCFVMGDRSHPETTQIYAYLDELIARLKEIGYTSAVNVVMQDVEEEEGEVLIGYHSEKLAVAFGIMSSFSGTSIRIMKNLRVCVDCHNFMKYTSQLLYREIIVRDIHRFHHFKSGQCSCGDYW